MSLLEHPTAQALLADAEVRLEDVADCRWRLECFLQRYLPRFYRIEQHGPFGYGTWTSAPAAAVVGTGTTATVHLEPNSGNLLFYRVVAYPPLTVLN